MRKGQARYLIPIALMLFIVSLTPRLAGLGQFSTPDEFLWFQRSSDFLSGLISNTYTCQTYNRGIGLECTLQTGHPGVTTMWTGSMGIGMYYLTNTEGKDLLHFTRTLPTKALDKNLVPWLRLPTAILTALVPPFIFLLLLRLLRSEGKKGFAVALLAALLAALSPFEIGLSRVLHHDALETVGFTLSILALLNYRSGTLSRRWLVLSGALAGFSILSKSPGLFLGVFFIFVEAWYTLAYRLEKGKWQPEVWKILLIDAAIWGGSILVTAFALWPALWVIPLKAVTTIFKVGADYYSMGHDLGSYFMGSVDNDPGPLFYPFSLLIRLTPFACLGFIIGLCFWLFGGKGETPSESAFAHRNGLSLSGKPEKRLFAFSLLLMLSFIAFMSLGAKKMDRYLLPVYPFVSIMAAQGWVWLVSAGTDWIKAIKRRENGLTWALAGVVMLGAATSGWLAWNNYPYYLTYFNPMLGGTPAATRMITVGWGEGLDLAAAYLNQKPDAKNQKVQTWHKQSFAPYFAGTTLNFTKRREDVMSADYVVMYIDQEQRDLPDKKQLDFIRQNYVLEKTISLQGVDYARIYRSIRVEQRVKPQIFSGQSEFWGWNNPPADELPAKPRLKAGDPLDFNLYWRLVGNAPAGDFTISLRRQEGSFNIEATCPANAANNLTPHSSDSPIIMQGCVLKTLPDMPLGKYDLRLGFRPSSSASADGEMTFETNRNYSIEILKND
jgi:4-amino-4-deoxy-L-arabinose transferase-like glycosyltransferase